MCSFEYDIEVLLSLECVCSSVCVRVCVRVVCVCVCVAKANFVWPFLVKSST